MPLVNSSCGVGIYAVAKSVKSCGIKVANCLELCKGKLGHLSIICIGGMVKIIVSTSWHKIYNVSVGEDG